MRHRCAPGLTSVEFTSGFSEEVAVMMMSACEIISRNFADSATENSPSALVSTAGSIPVVKISFGVLSANSFDKDSCNVRRRVLGVRLKMVHDEREVNDLRKSVRCAEICAPEPIATMVFGQFSEGFRRDTMCADKREPRKIEVYVQFKWSSPEATYFEWNNNNASWLSARKASSWLHTSCIPKSCQSSRIDNCFHPPRHFIHDERASWQPTVLNHKWRIRVGNRDDLRRCAQRRYARRHDQRIVVRCGDDQAVRLRNGLRSVGEGGEDASHEG